MALPVALQLYSVRDEVEEDLRGTLLKVKQMGYTGVEFAGLYNNKPSDIKVMLEEIGLIAVSAHVGLELILESPEKVIGEYATIGCKFIAIPYLSDESRPGKEGFTQTIKDIEVVAKEAKKHGIQLLYHNHDFEFVKLDGGEYGLDAIYRLVPSDLLKTEIDTCWVNVAGLNPSEYIGKYSGRSPVVHLKDFVMKGKEKPAHLYELIGIQSDKDETASEEAFGFRSVGHGVQDFPAILDASVQAGAEWVVVEQDRPTPGLTPMECVKLSRDYLAKLGW